MYLSHVTAIDAELAERFQLIKQPVGATSSEISNYIFQVVGLAHF